MQIPFLDATKGSLELLDEFQEGIWIADNSGRIVFANRALARLVGQNGRDTLTGRSWQEMLPAGAAARLQSSASPCAVTESALLTNYDRQIPASIRVCRRTESDGEWYVGSVLPTTGTKLRTEAAESASLRRRVDEALVNFSERERTALVLRHYHGFKVREIAQTMGISLGAVKSYLFRAIHKLQRELDTAETCPGDGERP